MLDHEIPLVLEWARYYLGRGWSVIPLRPNDKRPAIEWTPYQARLPTEAELDEWFGDGKKNIGIVTGRISGIAVVDIDSTQGWAALKPFIGDATNTPIVHTPRKGRHLYYTLPNGHTYGSHARRVPGADFRCEGGYVAAPPSIGANGEAYIWKKAPDLHLLALPLQYVVNILGGVVGDIIGNGGVGGGNNYIKESSKVVTSRQLTFEEGHRDDDLFSTAYGLLLGGMSADNARNILYRLTKSWNEPEPDQKVLKWIEDKIKSAEKRVKSRHENAPSLADEVRDWVKSSKGVFKSSELHLELAESSKVVKDYRKTISKILSRLVEEGLLVREGKRYGIFRRVDTITEPVDWRNASTETVWDLTYPFNIHELYHTLPKNIVVVDGTTDSGKTAFLLNVAYRNSHKYPGRIHYFTSEMGALELRSRIERFEDPSRFDQVRFFERCENFPDVIRPDDLNIIDFLELSDEFWKVGGIIREIHDRLNMGVCFIARQKLKGASAGRGGDFGKEKARLVLLMDPGVAKIDKCKNWRNPVVNPNGKEWRFKLVGGCRFIDQASNAVCEGEF